jgi:hypothetical protein
VGNLDFFAARDDLIAVLSFVFDETDFHVFESYSRFGETLRDFTSVDALDDAFTLGKDPHGNGFAITLQLWSPSVCKKPRVTKIKLDPKTCGGHSVRYNIDGFGLAQLYLGGVYKKIVTKSHFGHNSEPRAKKWGGAGGIDWKAMAQISGRLQRHVRKLAVAKAKTPGRPILPAALALAQKGYALKDMKTAPWSHEIA